MSGLRWLAQSLELDPRETRVVYLLSDFRQKDWRDSAEAVELSQKLKQAGCELNFVQCGRTVEPNVSIVDLVPDGGASGRRADFRQRDDSKSRDNRRDACSARPVSGKSPFPERAKTRRPPSKSCPPS